MSGRDAVTYYDPRFNVLREIPLDAGKHLPLLVVSRGKMQIAGIGSEASDLFLRAINSPIATLALILLAVIGASYWKLGSIRVSASAIAISACGIAIIATGAFVTRAVKDRLAEFAGDQRSQVRFSESNYDFHEIEIDSGRSATVTLVNGGIRPRQIQEIIGSCGCMSIEPTSRSLIAGGKVDCVVRFSTIKLGRNSHTLTAFVDDEPVNCLLQFEGVPGLSLLPRRKFAGELAAHSDESLIHELRVDGFRGDPIKEVSLETESTDSELEFELLGQPTFANNSLLSIRVQVNPDSEARGLHFERLLIVAGSGDEAVTCLAEIGVEIVDSDKP